MGFSFDNNFQKKYFVIQCKENQSFTKAKDFDDLKDAWLQNLGSWHSPYKVVMDFTGVEVASELASKFDFIQKYFTGFHLRKMIGFSSTPNNVLDGLPFSICKSIEDAFTEINIRAPKTVSSGATSLREKLLVRNDFQQNTMEVTSDSEVQINSKEDLQVLRSKIMNALMQWHSPWNLIFDGTAIIFAEGVQIEPMLKVFKGFHLESVVGYGPKMAKDLPFHTFRSRHRAMTEIQKTTEASGNQAHCQNK